MPKSEHVKGFDVPGYLLNQLQQDKDLFVRNVIFSESFWIELSEKLIEEKGASGKEILYEIGKNYGYRIGILNRFPKGNVSKVTMRAIFDFFIHSGIVSKVKTQRIDTINSIMELEIEDLIVSAKSGYWYCPGGSAAGFWCYLFDDYSLEYSSNKINKRRDLVLFGPVGILKDRGFEIIQSLKMPGRINLEQYIIHNKPPLQSDSKFNGLRNIPIYRNNGMLFISPNTRIFLLELSILSSLEELIGERILSSASYSSFYELGILLKGLYTVTDLLTTFGLGVVTMSENRNGVIITFNGYPWFTHEYNAKSFGYVKGAIVGFLDGNTGKKHNIEATSSKIVDNALVVTISVKTS